MAKVDVTSGPERVGGALALFGKHAALGTEHEERGLGRGADACAGFKIRLYNQGVLRLSQSGAWAGYAPQLLLAEYDHVVLVRQRAGVLVGRLLSSADPIGREVPLLVLCALSGPAGVTDWAVERGAAAVDLLCAGLEHAADRDDVERMIDACQRQLDETLAQGSGFVAKPGAGAGAPTKAAEELARLTKKHRGLLARLKGAGGLHIRVLRGPGPELVGMLAWLRMLQDAAPAALPHVLIGIRHWDWVDVWIGEPSSNEFVPMMLNLEGRRPDVVPDVD